MSTQKLFLYNKKIDVICERYWVFFSIFNNPAVVLSALLAYIFILINAIAIQIDNGAEEYRRWLGLGRFVLIVYGLFYIVRTFLQHWHLFRVFSGCLQRIKGLHGLGGGLARLHVSHRRYVHFFLHFMTLPSDELSVKWRHARSHIVIL